MKRLETQNMCDEKTAWEKRCWIEFPLGSSYNEPYFPLSWTARDTANAVNSLQSSQRRRRVNTASNTRTDGWMDAWIDAEHKFTGQAHCVCAVNTNKKLHFPWSSLPGFSEAVWIFNLSEKTFPLSLCCRFLCVPCRVSTHAGSRHGDWQTNKVI